MTARPQPDPYVPEFVYTLWRAPELRERRPDLPLALNEALARSRPEAQAETLLERAEALRDAEVFTGPQAEAEPGLEAEI